MTGTHEGWVHDAWRRPFAVYLSLSGTGLEMVDCEPLCYLKAMSDLEFGSQHCDAAFVNRYLSVTSYRIAAKKKSVRRKMKPDRPGLEQARALLSSV